MPDEAPLVDVGSGLVPAGDGWYVVNAREAAWMTHETFGSRCTFDASPRALGDRDDLEPRLFAQVGYTLSVLLPGERSSLYHSESMEESFLVLRGECLLLVEGEERRLREWDFVHCPPGTAHTFVATGDAPCVLFMTGARGPGKELRYPREQLALDHGAGVEVETSSPGEAYAGFPHWQPGSPPQIL